MHTRNPAIINLKAIVPLELLPIVPVFLETRRRDSAAIIEAIESGDFERIERIGHTMKGSGSAYGFHPISEMGRQLEAAAAARDVALIRHTVVALNAYLSTVEVIPE